MTCSRPSYALSLSKVNFSTTNQNAHSGCRGCFPSTTLVRDRLKDDLGSGSLPVNTAKLKLEECMNVHTHTHTHDVSGVDRGRTNHRDKQNSFYWVIKVYGDKTNKESSQSRVRKNGEGRKTWKGTLWGWRRRSGEGGGSGGWRGGRWGVYMWPSDQRLEGYMMTYRGRNTEVTERSKGACSATARQRHWNRMVTVR